VSRVGNNPIGIPKGVEIRFENNTVSVKGSKGELSQAVHGDMTVSLDEKEIVISRPNDSKFFKSLHGLYRSLIANMVEGVTSGFTKKLIIVGVGYRAETKGNRLILQLGFSHQIVLLAPDGIDIKAESPTILTVSGISKEIVGQVAAKIRSFRPPEPYKGKGIKYDNEQIRRKAGKTAG